MPDEEPQVGFQATEKVLQQGAEPSQPIVTPTRGLSPGAKKAIRTIIKILIIAGVIWISYKLLDSLGIIDQIKEGFFLLFSI